MRHHPQPATTIAILGADTVVGRALCALLESFGYRITPIDSRPTEDADDLLDGADLLLLAPGLGGGEREAFLGAIGKGAPNADVPAVALCTPLEEAPPEGAIGAPWPCEAGVLVERIEAVLAEAPPKGCHQQGGLLANGE